MPPQRSAESSQPQRETKRHQTSRPGSRPTPRAAWALIVTLPHTRNAEAFLFPRHAGPREQSSLIPCWRADCADANLTGPRLHDLRHSPAIQALTSVTLADGLPLVRRILGYDRHRTTASYASLPIHNLTRQHNRSASLQRVKADRPFIPSLAARRFERWHRPRPLLPPHPVRSASDRASNERVSPRGLSILHVV